MLRSVCSVPLALSLALPLAGQYGSTPLKWDRDFPTAPGYAGSVDCPQVWDFDGNGSWDIGYVRGGAVHVMVSPEAYGWFADTGVTGVSSIVSLDLDSSVGLDVLFAVGTGGTRIITYGGDGVGFSAMSLGLSSWDNVRRIVTASYGGIHYFAGVEDGDDVVRIGCWEPGVTFTDMGSFTTQDCLDVVIANWDNDVMGAPEVIVRNQTGLEAYDFTGQLVGAHVKSSALPDGSICRIDANGVDQIAWLWWGGTISDWRLRLIENGVQIQAFRLAMTSQVVQGFDAVNLAAGDYDADGHDDLLVYQASNTKSFVFRNQAHVGGVGFDLDEYYVVQTNGSTNAAQDTAPALFVDINHDHNSASPDVAGRPDIVIARPSEGKWRFYSELYQGLGSLGLLVPTETCLGGGCPPPTKWASMNDGEEDYPNIFLSADTGLNEAQSDNHLTLIVDPTHFSFANKLQVIVRRQLNPNVAGSQLVYHSDYLFDVASGAQTAQAQFLLDTASGTNQYGWDYDEVYYLEIRLLNVQGSAVVEASPTYLYGLSCLDGGVPDFQDALEYYIYSISQPCAPGTACSDEQGIGPPGGLTGNNRYIGGIKLETLKPPTKVGTQN